MGVMRILKAFVAAVQKTFLFLASLVFGRSQLSTICYEMQKVLQREEESGAKLERSLEAEAVGTIAVGAAVGF